MYMCLVCVYVLETIARFHNPIACITPIAVILFCLAGGICVACNW